MKEKPPKYKKNDIAYTDMGGQYVGVEIIGIKKGWFGWKYFCKFNYKEGGYGIEWIKESKLFD